MDSRREWILLLFLDYFPVIYRNFQFICYLSANTWRFLSIYLLSFVLCALGPSRWFYLSIVLDIECLWGNFSVVFAHSQFFVLSILWNGVYPISVFSFPCNKHTYLIGYSMESTLPYETEYASGMARIHTKTVETANAKWHKIPFWIERKYSAAKKKTNKITYFIYFAVIYWSVLYYVLQCTEAQPMA